MGNRTRTLAVLGECGRERYVTCIIKCVKYWLKLFNYLLNHYQGRATRLCTIDVIQEKLIGPVKLEIFCTAMALVGYRKTSMSQIQQFL